MDLLNLLNFKCLCIKFITWIQNSKFKEKAYISTVLNKFIFHLFNFKPIKL